MSVRLGSLENQVDRMFGSLEGFLNKIRIDDTLCLVPEMRRLASVNQEDLNLEPNPRYGDHQDPMVEDIEEAVRDFSGFPSPVIGTAIQDQVRKLIKVPLEDTQIEVDWLRQSLTSELFKLESHPGLVRLADTAGVELTNDNPADFDDLDAESGRNEDVILPEHHQIILPSTHMLDNRSLCKEELRLWIKQATRYLSAIREGVAEKSFQYAHVMRMVASKEMET